MSEIHKIVMILFTQSTAALQKCLNDKLKLLCLLQFFPEVAQNSPSFPCSGKSLSIPGLGGSVAEWLATVGPGFKSQPRRCWVTVLGKLFAPIVPLFTKQQNW